jgi:hypothetical protein
LYSTLFSSPATLVASSSLSVSQTWEGTGACVSDLERDDACAGDAFAFARAPFGRSDTSRSLAHHPAAVLAFDATAAAPDVAWLSARDFLDRARGVEIDASPPAAQVDPVGIAPSPDARARHAPAMRYEAAGRGKTAERARPLMPLTYQGIELSPRGDGGAHVLAREALMMSDIPELALEFQRLKRDELLVLKFLDVFHPIAKKHRHYHEVPRKERETLAEALVRADLDVHDAQSVRAFLSRILRCCALRYGEDANGYAPDDIVCPLIACQRAKMIHLEFEEEAARTCFYDLKSVSQAVDHLRRSGMKSSPEAEKLAQSMYDIHQIFYGTRPLFHRDDRRYVPLVVMAKDNLEVLPEAFLAGPSRFIELQANVQQGKTFSHALTFNLLNLNPYDTTRVKRFSLGGVPVISKRVEPLRVRAIEEEILRAREMEQVARAAGIEGVRSVRYLGLVYDAGNFYVLMRDEQAPSLHDAPSGDGKQVLERVKAALAGQHHDLEPRNALWNGTELILLDFEEHATSVSIKRAPPEGEAISAALLSRARTADGLTGLPLWQPVIRRFRAAIALANPRALRKLPPTAVIGDIHGSVRRLSQILESDPVKRAARTIFLGDYFDRGKGGKEVFELLRKRPSDENVFLLGNHELYLLLAMKGDRASFISWLGNGALEFIGELVDLTQFRASFERACAALPEGIASELVDWIAREEPHVIEALERDVRGNASLQEMRDWLLSQGQILFLDEYSHLYVHAGLAGAEKLGPDFFITYLEAEEKFMDALQPDSAASAEQAALIAKEFRSILEMRESEWIREFPQNDWRKTVGALTRLGIRGVVVGHTPRGKPMSQMNRIFGIDLQMADYYGGRGGLLELSPSAGVAVHRFADSETAQLETEVLQSGEEFREDLQMDGEALVKEFQRHFLKRIP